MYRHVRSLVICIYIYILLCSYREDNRSFLLLLLHFHFRSGNEGRNTKTDGNRFEIGVSRISIILGASYPIGVKRD